MHADIVVIAHQQQGRQVVQQVTDASHAARIRTLVSAWRLTAWAECDQVVQLIGCLATGEAAEGLNVMHVQGLCTSLVPADLASVPIPL